MNPLQQGLKQTNPVPLQQKTWVAIMNPLQQGLKLPLNHWFLKHTLVAIMNPLQQGLKHFVLLRVKRDIYLLQ